MAAMMSDVLERLLAVEKRKTPTPVRFQLQNIVKLTGNISLVSWMAALNENVKSTPNFTDGEVVSVSDAALIQAVDALFGSYSRIELLQHIGWFFVLTLAPLGNISMLDEGLVQIARPVFCASEVEASYGELLASLYVRARFSKKERAEITLALVNITRTALDKISSVRWSNDVSKLTALKKLEQVKLVLWPSDDLLTFSTLNEMYAPFLSQADTFIAFWLDGHRRLRELTADHQYSLMLSLPSNSQLPLFDYDRLLDTVGVSVAALSAPVYYGRSTPVMLYSGLGFAFAQQLVKALDSVRLEVS
ncbi:hypothetical protein V5799_010639 [Amblyomma americanum]|uniref:Peptidase M13 N-terminal domain-containing protein n=1 Tax=Amblyomma americanum TaxID=6943 RepID=A0AAQ4EJB6_AMBAM